MKLAKLLVVFFLLLATGCVLLRRGDADRLPAGRPLQDFPQAIGPWTGTDEPLEPYVLEVLGKGVFLNRTYVRKNSIEGIHGAADTASVGLFIGYFPTQRTGQAIHSPQNCLPGAGWTFVTKGTATLPGQEEKTATVGEYLITNGSARDIVLYWYRSHGRTVASDYAAKWYTLTDSIWLQRTDGALVRVITPLAAGEDPDGGRRRALDFASSMNRQLGAYLPD